jgi:endonuclease-3
MARKKDRTKPDRTRSDHSRSSKAKSTPRRRTSHPPRSARAGKAAKLKGPDARLAADEKAAAGALAQWTPAEIEEAFRRFQSANPVPKGELAHINPFTLLVAVVLSAQATDAGVNKATPALFAAADTPEKMVALGEERVQDLIKTIGLFRTKAKNVVALSKKLVEEHAGQVPSSREALEALPGVGRKTANVVLNIAFGEPTIAVDTHIFRVGNRTGLAIGKTPFEVETKLDQIVPAKYKRHAHHWLILHGRYVCLARRPLCERCLIADLCKWPGKTAKEPCIVNGLKDRGRSVDAGVRNMSESGEAPQIGMECVILVDNSNLFIEGRKFSAARKGIVIPTPEGKLPQDPSWRLDFSGLLAALADGRKIRQAFLVGSRPPPNDNVWKMAEQSGFKVKTHERDRNDKEKAVDAELVAQGTRIICTTPAPAVLVIASGDRDFVPLVNIAHEMKWTVEMAAFNSAFSPTGEMATSVDKIRQLDAVFDKIGNQPDSPVGVVLHPAQC